MELKVGVKILLRNKEGKYLFILRSVIKYPTAGAKWDIPGGRINPGSTLMENLKREVGEETSLSIVGEPKLLGAQDIFGNDYHTVRLTYIGEAGGVEVMLSDEHTEYKWADLNEIESLDPMDKYLKEIIKDIKL